MTADKIIRDFEKINDKVVKLVPEMVQVTGTKIQMDAKRDVPRDTSRLHNSIKNYAEDGGLTAVIETNVEYAPYVEFGTGSMVSIPSGMNSYASQFRGSGIRDVNTSPQPFMMPAFERHSQRFIDALNKLIRDL